MKEEGRRQKIRSAGSPPWRGQGWVKMETRQKTIQLDLMNPGRKDLTLQVEAS